MIEPFLYGKQLDGGNFICAPHDAPALPFIRRTVKIEPVSTEAKVKQNRLIIETLEGGPLHIGQYIGSVNFHRMGTSLAL